jgi:hypothetical protein
MEQRANAVGESLGDGTGARSEFVEVPLFTPAAAASCILEVGDSSGRRLRVELQGKSLEEVETVVRALWRAAR